MRLITCFCVDCDNPDLTHDENDKEDFNSTMEYGGVFHLWNCAHIKAIMELCEGVLTSAPKTDVECDCSTKAA